ncbi:MAG: tetratricopeptide repeat protein, partial [Planctomycetota bacterium]
AAALPPSADEGAARRLALREAQEPLRARHWADAVQTLRRFREIHRATPEAVEAWVLEARALYLAGRAREALDATSAFLAAHGEAAWAGRMKFTAADAYAKLGDAKQGAATLRKRVNAATSVEARAAIGALHLKLADQDFDGVETKDDLGRTVKKRNVARALASYRHALEVGLEPEQAVRARERIALCLEEQKNYAEAAPAWKGLLEDADSGKLGTGAGGEAVARWSVGLGRSLLRGGQLPQARKVLREVLAAKPGGGLRMEVELLLGEERLETARQKSDDVAFEEGVTWIRRAIVENPDDERVAKSWKGLALAYEAHGDVEKAAAEWGALIERFPKADFVPQARDHRAQDLVRAGRFDRAIAEWERFLAAHPNDPLWQSVRGKIVEAAFRKGAWFANAADDPGAIAAWRAFAEKYPTDGRAPQALPQAAALLRKDQDFEAALTLARQVSGRYAKTAQAAPALWLEATILEDDLARLDDAVEVYEKLIEEYGSCAPVPEAQARLARLKEKHLELRMPRVIGTKEKPVLQVTTRNVKKLDVRVYRLDMEEYFRRKGTVLGVENLQLEVVKPDETATWTLAEYHPFEQVQADRSVPVEGKGAYVVVAGDEDLTATVLFLVSDAEIVVKKARGRDLLVWAFEREDQKPLAGASVLVARGRKVR